MLKRGLYPRNYAGVKSIQDAYYGTANVGGNETRAFFAVYDGHGGHRASEFAAEHLHGLVTGNPEFRLDDEPGLALEAAFKELDRAWLTLAARHGWDDGSTAISALLVDNKLFVANVGDSRAVLSSQGKAVEMSHDHKPIREDEKQRIEKLGGRIVHYGTWRVEGVLAVTRAIGDRRLKKYVSAAPEIRERVLRDGDDWLILASDGVWDVLSNQAAVDIVGECRDAAEAARRLTDMAYKRGSLDNITSLVVDLRAYRARLRALGTGLGSGSGSSGETYEAKGFGPGAHASAAADYSPLSQAQR